jgi:ATP-independent RNA helicase DbpA
MTNDNSNDNTNDNTTDNIKVNCNDADNSNDQLFSSLSLREALLKNLDSLGYKNMTPIQAQSLPLMLKGEDVIGQAKTGSGKTAAFGLSLLHRLDLEKYAVQALVLCPTRELAEQVSQALRQLARQLPNIKVLNLSGGMPMNPQLDSLRHGAHIIVGTPGRVKKHLDKESLSLNRLRALVLDEADRMLDMGFYEAIGDIIAFCPEQRQTLLFSATYPSEIKKLANKFMHNPKRIIVEEKHSELDIEQVFYELNHQSNKFPLLKTLLLHHKPLSTLIFCNTKEQTAELSNSLKKEGFSAIALNGDMEQFERDLAIIQFKNKSSSILVATDVAARGLDIKELPAVINYDLAFEHDVHIHRIGRTGRAGSKGLAISLTTPSDAERLCAIEDGLNHPIVWANANELKTKNTKILLPEMATLCLYAGKKDKIRPGDILGALTKDAGLNADAIGKIDITALYSYVAIKQNQADNAYQYFITGKLKGRKVNVKKVK